MKVKIEEFRCLFKILLDHVEKRYGKEIELPGGQYWNISFEHGQKMEQPEAFLDDLCDDWEFVSKLLIEDIASSDMDYERLGNIIRAIGYTMYKK